MKLSDPPKPILFDQSETNIPIWGREMSVRDSKGHTIRLYIQLSKVKLIRRKLYLPREK